MSKTNEGGPAFPHMMADGHKDYAPGMTLRDWFAGQALAGFLASKAHSTSFHPSEDAEYVYAIADAMLKARGGE